MSKYRLAISLLYFFTTPLLSAPCFSLTSLHGLHFNHVVPMGGGTYFISPNSPASATLLLSGKPHKHLYIEIAEHQVKVREAHTSNTLMLNAFHANYPARLPIPLPPSGHMMLRLGGQLRIPAYFQSGVYTGHVGMRVRCGHQRQIYSVPLFIHLVRQINITTLSPLRFGRVIAGYAQTIRIRPIQSQAAHLQITGPPHAIVRVTLTHPVIFLKNTVHNTQTIRVDHFNFSNNVYNNLTQLSHSGQRFISLGASAHIKSKEKPGHYTGNIQVNALLIR